MHQKKLSRKVGISTHKTARIATRKVHLVASSIRGLPVDVAIRKLNFTEKKSAGMILKVLNSAIANAVNNFGLNRSELFVSDVKIGPGSILKRARFQAKGRYAPIKKRTTNITIEVSAKDSGKPVVKEEVESQAKVAVASSEVKKSDKSMKKEVTKTKEAKSE